MRNEGLLIEDPEAIQICDGGFAVRAHAVPVIHRTLSRMHPETQIVLSSQSFGAKDGTFCLKLQTLGHDCGLNKSVESIVVILDEALGILKALFSFLFR